MYSDFWFTDLFDHDHEWELHCIIFLDQSNESVVLVGTGAHAKIFHHSPSEVTWIDQTHPLIFVAKGSHAADKDRDIWLEKSIPGYPFGPGWEGDGVQLSHSAFKNILVYDTEACTEEQQIGGLSYFCHITNWGGEHLYWDETSKYWWACLPSTAAWHQDVWDEPTVGSYG